MSCRRTAAQSSPLRLSHQAQLRHRRRLVRLAMTTLSRLSLRADVAERRARRARRLRLGDVKCAPLRYHRGRIARNCALSGMLTVRLPPHPRRGRRERVMVPTLLHGRSFSSRAQGLGTARSLRSRLLALSLHRAMRAKGVEKAAWASASHSRATRLSKALKYRCYTLAVVVMMMKSCSGSSSHSRTRTRRRCTSHYQASRRSAHLE